MSREAILGRVRDALARKAGVRLVPAPPSGRIDPALSGAISIGERVAHFRRQAEAKGTAVVEVAGWENLPRAVSVYMQETATGVTSLRMCAGLPPQLDWSAVGLACQTGPAANNDVVGLSHAMAAVAETGTLVLASDPGNPVTLAFLPDIHLIAIARGAILSTFEDAARLLSEAYPNGRLPRSLNFISGASRTGDIGGRIVHGAHGPRTLAVFVIDGHAHAHKTTGHP